MKKTLFIFSILLLFIFGNSLLLEKNAVGAIIDFENVGVDKDPISTQYPGVNFFLSNRLFPNLEEVNRTPPITPGGDTFLGFYNDIKLADDIEAAGFVGQLGDYYLRLDQFFLQLLPVPVLVVEFSTPLSEASGEIWDIDATAAIPGYEQWKVTARNANGSFLDSIDSPMGLDVTDHPSSLDGRPWEWSFAGGTGLISSIEIEWIGTKESGIGIALDNFEYTSAPIPGAIWLFGSGILGMVFIRRKLKN